MAQPADPPARKSMTRAMFGLLGVFRKTGRWDRVSRSECAVAGVCAHRCGMAAAEAECEPEDKIAALRSLSHTFYLQSRSARSRAA